MHVKDRSQIAYLVVKDSVGGVYQPGDHFHSELLNLDQAKRYLDAGTIVELEPGDDPAAVYEANKPQRRPRAVATDEPTEPPSPKDPPDPVVKPPDDSGPKDQPFGPDTKPVSPKASK